MALLRSRAYLQDTKNTVIVISNESISKHTHKLVHIIFLNDHLIGRVKSRDYQPYGRGFNSRQWILKIIPGELGLQCSPSSLQSVI